MRNKNFKEKHIREKLLLAISRIMYIDRTQSDDIKINDLFRIIESGGLNLNVKKIKMEREDVYKLIDDEMEYQDTIRRENENDTKNDNEKSIADFLVYIEYTLDRAKKEIYNLNEKDAMEYIRKIAALSVAAMENFETPKREI